MKKLIYLTTLISISFSALVSAQEFIGEKGGYVDTMGIRHEGYIQVSLLNKKRIIFWKSPEDKSIHLNPTNVNQVFTSDSVLIRTVEISYRFNNSNKKETVFAQKVYADRMSLYEAVINGYGPVFFLETEQEYNLQRINGTAPSKYLELVAGDCAEAVKKGLEYQRKAMIEQVAELNECLYGERAKIKKVKTKYSLSFGFRGGYGRINPKALGIFPGDYKNKGIVTAGVFLESSLFKMFRWRLGFDYRNYTLESEKDDFSYQIIRNTSDTIVQYFTYFQPANFQMDLIEMPLELMTFFNKQGRIQPFVLIGASIMAPLTQRSYFDTENPKNAWEWDNVAFSEIPKSDYPKTDNNLVELTYQSSPISLRSAFFGFGFSKKLSSQQAIQFSLKYFISREFYTVESSKISPIRRNKPYQINSKEIQAQLSYSFLSGGNK